MLKSTLEKIILSQLEGLIFTLGRNNSESKKEGSFEDFARECSLACLSAIEQMNPDKFCLETQENGTAAITLGISEPLAISIEHPSYQPYNSLFEKSTNTLQQLIKQRITQLLKESIEISDYTRIFFNMEVSKFNGTTLSLKEICLEIRPTQ